MIFIQSRTNGIYGFKDENGIGIKRKITSGIGSGNLPSDKILSSFDHDGELWIGTDEGLVVLYSPDNVFDGSETEIRDPFYSRKKAWSKAAW